jgi:ribosomal protein S18 acetylase RimI-like enzyme
VEIKIRNATPVDQTLIASFNSLLAKETEGKRLDPALIGPGVAAILNNDNLGRYWIAEVDSAVAGQIMVTYEWSDWRNGMIWWIQSVYVPEKFRRKGIFRALYRHVESLVKEDQNARGLRLYVEENNTRAIQTYRDLHMSEPGYRVMESLAKND